MQRYTPEQLQFARQEVEIFVHIFNLLDTAIMMNFVDASEKKRDELITRLTSIDATPSEIPHGLLSFIPDTEIEIFLRILKSLNTTHLIDLMCTAHINRQHRLNAIFNLTENTERNIKPEPTSSPVPLHPPAQPFPTYLNFFPDRNAPKQDQAVFKRPPNRRI